MVELEKHRHLQKVIPLPEENDGSNAEAKGSSVARRRATSGSRILRERRPKRWDVRKVWLEL